MIKTSYIAKMVNGKPQIFATTQKDNGAPVYIFTEKDTFDAAIADHLIPVGALIVKTYDAIEMAGGPFDPALSTESENAPQNKAVAAEFNKWIDNAYKYQNGSYLHLTNLGTSYTQELKEDIVSGTFKKAVVGGYLTINEHLYYLAHPDYWLNTGDTPCTTHHMVVVPAENLVTAKMNASDTTEGGYIGSDMKKAGGGLEHIKSIIQTDFGEANILTHREILVNAVANGKPSGYAWYDSDIDLMNELMVYGSYIFTPACDGTTISFRHTNDRSQLALFTLRPDLICNRAAWWLRDVVSSACFSLANSDGYANFYYAPTALGARPAFGIC